MRGFLSSGRPLKYLNGINAFRLAWTEKNRNKPPWHHCQAGRAPGPSGALPIFPSSADYIFIHSTTNVNAKKIKCANFSSMPNLQRQAARTSQARKRRLDCGSLFQQGQNMIKTLNMMAGVYMEHRRMIAPVKIRKPVVQQFIMNAKHNIAARRLAASLP